MQQPPAAPIKSTCHAVAADQNTEENSSRGMSSTAIPGREFTRPAPVPKTQHNLQCHDVVAEQVRNSNPQFGASATGSAGNQGDGLSASHVTSCPSMDPIAEDILLASDTEMLSLSNKGSERGSSILASGSRSPSESSNPSFLEPASRREQAHSSGPSNQFRRDDFGNRDSLFGQVPMEASNSGLGSPESWKDQARGRWGTRRPWRRSEAEPYPPRGALAQSQHRPPQNYRPPFRGSRRGRRLPREQADRLPAPVRQAHGPLESREERQPANARHPWAHLVKPRQLQVQALKPEQVTNDLPEERYRPIPKSGYLSMKFCRSLFPQVASNKGRVTGPIPFIELPTLEDAIRFREESEEIIRQAIDGQIAPLPQPSPDSLAPKDVRSSEIFPQSIPGKQPVLYQIVAIRNNALLLEAKDFFVFLPDRLDLHCILLDRFAYNVQNSTYGYSRPLVSVRDFVWIYDVQPVANVLTSPAEHLTQARIPRMSATDPDASIFFRAHRFMFVTPSTWREERFGFVLSLPRREGFLNNFLLAAEDSPEAVTVSRTLAQFSLRAIRDGDVVRVASRKKVSCAVRFSEPPACDMARDALCHAVKMFLPAYPNDALQPMEVAFPSWQDREWITDRARNFDSYVHDRETATVMMGRLFNAAASALAAYASREDDLATHRVTATVPNLDSYPLRLTFQLLDMNQEAGWTRHRFVGVWIPGTDIFLRLKVECVEQDWAARRLDITLHTTPWNGGTLIRAIVSVGETRDRSATLPVLVRLEKHDATSIPAYEAVSQMKLLTDVPSTSVGRKILDAVYGATPLTTARGPLGEEGVPPLFVVDEAIVSIRGRPTAMTEDQRQALALGNTDFPVVGIQAAFGTGKTVVGACIAAQQARRGRHVIVTATTNAAVAQITETLLALDQYADLAVCRYVAETVAFDESLPATPVDMHQILKGLPDHFRGSLDDDQLDACVRFRDGRVLLEQHVRARDHNERLTSEEREELLLAERDVADTVDRVVSIMFALYKPSIIAITTSSLLNSTARRGIFEHFLDEFDLVLCDEASQVPEPVFAAILSRLPQARHVYVGDLHQLEPYALCSRHLDPVFFGGRSVMEILTRARAVPMAPLITTFRAHPALNALPNSFVYEGTLRNGTPAQDRRMLLDVMRFPCPDLPFMFIDVGGASQRALSRSHFNEREAELCLALIRRLKAVGIRAESLCVVAFYKEQHRRLVTPLRDAGVDLSTVDSIQGREKDVVIVLTTRTDITPESAEFLDDCHRMNVALTRCRHGQFILGHQRGLAAIPTWSTVLDWAWNHRCIVPAEQVDAFFPPA